MATEMNLSAQFSRTNVGAGLDPLEVNAEDGSYRIIAVGPGEKKYRRETAESPVVDGRVLLSAVLDSQTIVVKIRVRGSSHAQLQARIAALYAACDQRSYSLTVTMGGQQLAWLCEPADMSPGDVGAFVAGDIRALQQVISCEIPRSPRPLAGAY